MARRPCVFALSRRFRVEAIDRVVADTIEPTLREFGIPLTCTYASDDPDEPDHWVNRMGFIYDLADVHVVIDIDRSGNTLYEYETSNLLSASTRSTFLYWTLGLRCTQKLQHYRIIVHDQGKTYRSRSPTYFDDPLRIGRRGPSGSSVLVPLEPQHEFKRNFPEALETCLAATQAQEEAAARRERTGVMRRYMDPQPWNERVIDEALFDIGLYNEVRVALAERIAAGATPAGLAVEIDRFRAHPEEEDTCSAAAGNEPEFFHRAIHDALAMAEYAQAALLMGDLAAKALHHPDDVETRKEFLGTALAWRLSFAMARPAWSLESFEESRRRMWQNRIGALALGLLAKNHGP